MSEGAGNGSSAVVGRCPTCGKPGRYETRPFCSARCRDVDLNRWLKGHYSIPAVESEPDDPDDK